MCISYKPKNYNGATSNGLPTTPLRRGPPLLFLEIADTNDDASALSIFLNSLPT